MKPTTLTIEMLVDPHNNQEIASSLRIIASAIEQGRNSGMGWRFV